MDQDAEVWRKIAYCLLRRQLGPSAAVMAIMLEPVELEEAGTIRGDWDTDEAGRVLVSFEKSGAGS